MSTTMHPVAQWEQDGLAILMDGTMPPHVKLARLRDLAEDTIAEPRCDSAGCEGDAAYCWQCASELCRQCHALPAEICTQCASE